MIQVRDTVITGSTGIFTANTAVVGHVDVIVLIIVGLRGVGWLLCTDDAAVMIVTSDVRFAGVVNGLFTLVTV